MKRLSDQINPDTRAAFAALYHLSWPVIMSRVGVMLMGLMDTIIVGRYSSVQLALLMLAQSVFWVPAVSGMGLLMGVQVKTSHFLGSGELERIGAVFRRAIVYAGLLSLGFMALLLFGGDRFMSLAVSPAIARDTHLPLILFTVSMPGFLISMACTQFLEALGRTRDVLISTLVANALNVALLFALVPGHFSLFGVAFSGAMGAATATLIARVGLAIGMLIYVVLMKETQDFGLLKKSVPDHDGAVEQRHIGYATGASYFIEVAAFAGMTLFAGRVDEAAVACWGIILNFSAIVFMVPLGISAGCSVLVGKAYGAKDKAGLARTGRVSFLSAGAFCSLVVLSVLTAAPLIAHGYTSDASLFPIVRHGLILACLYFIPDGLQVVAAQALRARKDILAPTMIHYVSYGAIMLPLGFLFCLTFSWGVDGLIGAVVAASAISGTFQTGRFLWLDKRSTGAAVLSK